MHPWAGAIMYIISKCNGRVLPWENCYQNDYKNKSRGYNQSSIQAPLISKVKLGMLITDLEQFGLRARFLQRR